MFINRSKGLHNHVKFLGVGDDDSVENFNDSFICDKDVHKAAELIIEVVRSQIFSGKVFLITGPTGCGKTALTVALSEELGSKFPFVSKSASDFNSNEIKNTEILEESLRKAILVKIYEVKDIYEGEVTSFDENNITIRSLKGTKTFKLSKELQDQISYQMLRVGDVVHIDSSSGILKKMGRSESCMNDFDLEAERYVPLPKGEIYKRREFIHETTLHDLDISQVNPTGQDNLSLIHQIVSNKKFEITDKLRNDVDNLVISNQNCEVFFGVLHIDNAHLLDKKTLLYLKKAIDLSCCPTIILTVDIEKENIHNNAEKLFYGMPQDLLNKCLVIPMKKNDIKTEKLIIEKRLKKDQVITDNQTLEYFYKLCSEKGLIYVIEIISLLRSYDKIIQISDVEEITSIFSSI